MLGGLILQSPMKSCLKTRFDLGFDFTSKTGDCNGDSLDMFATQNYITSVECPVFLIHGHLDRTIPCSHSRYLYNLATSARDTRWALKEKVRKVREKEEGVMVWLLETKMRRREERERREREREEAWRKAEGEKDQVGVIKSGGEEVPPTPGETSSFCS